jgi:hypothetical protein
VPRARKSLSAGIEIAHDDAEHLPSQPGLALGHLHPGTELAGLIGQIVIGACHGGKAGASAADESSFFGAGDPLLEGWPTLGRRI